MRKLAHAVRSEVTCGAHLHCGRRGRELHRRAAAAIALIAGVGSVSADENDVDRSAVNTGLLFAQTPYWRSNRSSHTALTVS